VTWGRVRVISTACPEPPMFSPAAAAVGLLSRLFCWCVLVLPRPLLHLYILVGCCHFDLKLNRLVWKNLSHDYSVTLIGNVRTISYLLIFIKFHIRDNFIIAAFLIFGCIRLFPSIEFVVCRHWNSVHLVVFKIFIN